MNSNNTLKSLFLEQLADMYDSEHRITKALPKLIEAATCTELKSALEKHLKETEEQIQKLDQVFKAFDEKANATKCNAITGILAEGDEIVKKHKKDASVNAAIIAAAQKVEHYEIATYGTLKAWAKILGNNEAADILEEILDEEKEADESLNELSAAKNEEALEEAEAGTVKR